MIVEGEDRYGEGVNVAARLRQVADRARYGLAKGHQRLRISWFPASSRWAQKVKNIAEPAGFPRHP
ncbi:hypothetical protein C6558_11920 [Ensifer sp. NM-2]|nr:hypothetical protein C6558_11920 [Ensifer sp. NM-2]